MIRFALLAFALTACVGDPQTETSTTDQDSTVIGGVGIAGIVDPCLNSKIYYDPCAIPVLWDPSTANTIKDFWYGEATNAEAKVMFRVDMYGRSAADVGGGEKDPSTYVIFIQGPYSGNSDTLNTYWKSFEVKGSQKQQFNSTVRGLYDTKESIIGFIWDGGAGGTNGGSPGGHIGPHGFPQILIKSAITLVTGNRGVYGDIQTELKSAPGG